MMRGRTAEQIIAERGPMGFAPVFRDPPEPEPCPCDYGERCPVHDEPAVAVPMTSPEPRDRLAPHGDKLADVIRCPHRRLDTYGYCVACGADVPF